MGQWNTFGTNFSLRPVAVVYLSLYKTGYILATPTSVLGTRPPEAFMHLNASGGPTCLPDIFVRGHQENPSVLKG